MNSNKTEKIGVNAIRNIVLECPKLDEDIPTGDKAPSWDGEILVYNNEEQKKAQLDGKVPVQVKGMKVSKFANKPLKYKLCKADLENYLKSNGAIFFVVEYTTIKKIRVHYLMLLPIDIRNILNEMGTQKSKKKIFNRLPLDSRAFDYLCRNFLFHSKKQNLPLLNIDNAKYDTIGGEVLAEDQEMFKDYLLENGTYAYGYVKELGLQIPLYKIDVSHIFEEDYLNVGVNKKIFYDKVVRKKEKDKITLLFGKSFKIIFQKEEGEKIGAKGVNVLFRENGNLQERIKDCNFMLEIVKHRAIEFNNLAVDLDAIVQEEDFLKDLPPYIKDLEEIKETFKILNVNFNLNYEELSKEDHKHMLILRDLILRKDYSILERMRVKNSRKLNVIIGDKKILLLVFNTEGEWKVYDLFDYKGIESNFRIAANSLDPTRKPVPHSIYIGLTVEMLLGVSNLNVKNIKESILAVDYNLPETMELSTNFLLNIIRAYDKDKSRKDLLELAKEISHYLVAVGKGKGIYLINMMQITKRVRDLTVDEIEKLIELRSSSEVNDELLCGILILLESYSEFKVNFRKLTPNQKDSFKNYPIFDLVSDKLKEELL